MGLRRDFLDTLLPLAAGLAVLSAASCSRDPRLTGQRIRHVQVKTIVGQGLELGPLPAGAAPARIEEEIKKVAYVLLRAMRDDLRADGDRDAREAALDRQFAVCAPQRIYAEHTGIRIRAVDTPDEAVLKSVRTWTPTVAYYADDFDVDLPTAARRMSVGASGKDSGLTDRYVLLSLPDRRDAKAPLRALYLGFTHEQGYWRVWQVGFLPGGEARSTGAAGTRPAPATQPERAAG